VGASAAGPAPFIVRLAAADAAAAAAAKANDAHLMSSIASDKKYIHPNFSTALWFHLNGATGTLQPATSRLISCWLPVVAVPPLAVNLMPCGHLQLHHPNRAHQRHLPLQRGRSFKKYHRRPLLQLRLTR
jgi:hypothetical protein